MKRLHTALILAIGFVFVLGSLLAQVPISTSGAPHWQEKMNLSKYALHQDVFITSGITLLNSAGTSTLGDLTSADLVALAGSSSTELGYLSGVTAGTVSASKAVVVDATKKVDTWDPTELKIGGTAITATAAELNALDITAAGTAQASKAVVLGADSKINAMDITSLKLGGTTLTPTAAEINLLLQSTAAGKKVAVGTADVTSSSTITSATHGLATVTAVFASLSDPPSLDANDTATSVSGTDIILYIYKPTASGDCTPIEATDPKNVQWFAIGT